MYLNKRGNLLYYEKNFEIENLLDELMNKLRC